MKLSQNIVCASKQIRFILENCIVYNLNSDVHILLSAIPKMNKLKILRITLG